VPTKPMFLPSEEEINALIAATGKQTSTFLLACKETGARTGELAQLKWTAIDFKRKTVAITPEKNSNPRILPLSDRLIAMLNRLRKRPDGHIFNPNTRTLQDVFRKQKNKLAIKLGLPRLKQVTFRSLRHYKGTQVYYDTLDSQHVMYILGHKRLDTTQKYVHYLGLRETTFVVKVAKTIEEAIELAEAGFQLWDSWDGVKIYRKLKTKDVLSTKKIVAQRGHQASGYISTASPSFFAAGLPTCFV